jgi:DNA replication licensing factor MCM6
MQIFCVLLAILTIIWCVVQNNVAMTAPIMSRFDLFFVIVDECNEVTDYNIARHITNMHRLIDDAIETVYTTEEVRPSLVETC